MPNSMLTTLIAMLVALALMLGIVIGEAYAPISGHTTQKLDTRISEVEGALQAAELRCSLLTTRIDKVYRHVNLER